MEAEAGKDTRETGDQIMAIGWILAPLMLAFYAGVIGAFVMLVVAAVKISNAANRISESLAEISATLRANPRQ